MPHQLRRLESGRLSSQFSLAWPLLPESIKPIGSFPGDRGPDGTGIAPLSHGAVVGEGNVADIQHVLQQCHRIHRQIAEGVLDGPALGVVLQGRHQRQPLGIGLIGGTHPDEEKALTAGCRQAGAVGSPALGSGGILCLRD